MITFKTQRAALIRNLDYLRSLSVQDYTAFKKWEEIRTMRYDPSLRIKTARERIWQPTDIHNERLTIKEIEELAPELQLVDCEVLEKVWMVYRLFEHSGEYNHPVGRFIKWIIRDAVTKKILGIASITSDVAALATRDNYLGWTRDQRHLSGKLNHIANAQTLIATQPFGFNFLGGKLIAGLITSNQIRDQWQRKYGDLLVGMTTMSLFGVPSQYDSLRWWKQLGTSKGEVPIEPSADLHEWFIGYLKSYHPAEYEAVTIEMTNPKSKALELLFRVVDIPLKEYRHGHERGVYFSSSYQNTKEFLCEMISADELKPKAEFSVDWWRRKAIDRYLKLKREGRLKPDKTFYSELLKERCNFETAKKKFFGMVGR